MVLGDLSENTLFNELHGDEVSVLWRVVHKYDDISVSLCASVGSRSKSEYKPYCLMVSLFPTQQKLFL